MQFVSIAKKKKVRFTKSKLANLLHWKKSFLDCGRNANDAKDLCMRRWYAKARIAPFFTWGKRCRWNWRNKTKFCSDLGILRGSCRLALITHWYSVTCGRGFYIFVGQYKIAIFIVLKIWRLIYSKNKNEVGIIGLIKDLFVFLYSLFVKIITGGHLKKQQLRIVYKTSLWSIYSQMVK